MTGLAWVRRIFTAVWLTAVFALLVGLLGLTAVGWKIEVVATGSMEPTVPKGSAALVSPIGAAEVSGIAVGDVITFERDGLDRRVLHRVVDVRGTGPSLAFRTQGDANAEPDPQLVPASAVRGRLERSSPLVGSVLLALRPPLGLVWLVGVPLAVMGGSGLLRRVRPDPSGETGDEAEPAGQPVAGDAADDDAGHQVEQASGDDALVTSGPPSAPG